VPPIDCHALTSNASIEHHQEPCHDSMMAGTVRVMKELSKQRFVASAGQCYIQVLQSQFFCPGKSVQHPFTGKTAQGTAICGFRQGRQKRVILTSE